MNEIKDNKIKKGRTKYIVGYIILAVLVVIALFIWFKFGYVPRGQMYRIRYENLTVANVKGDVEEKTKEFTKWGYHVRCGFLTPGDTITYTFNIVNDGTMNVKLAFDPIFMGFDNLFKRHIVTNLLDEKNEPIKKGDVLKPGDVRKVKFIIDYVREASFPSRDSQNYETTVIFPYLQDR